MKKLIAAALVGALLLVSGCAVKPAADDGKPVVVTTIFPAYDMARAVFGESADILLLLKPGMESHSYDPSARDIVKISLCDLFVYNGGESDRWVENILSSTDGVETFRMTACVDELYEEHVDGMQEDEHSHDHEEHDDHDDHDHEEYDEHVWTSPKNALLILQGLCAKAVELFPENAADYERRAAAYAERITALDESFAQLLDGEERPFIFGDRFPLLYFFKEYGLSYYAAFPGCGSEVEPSAQTVTFLLEKLRGGDVLPAVFCIELSNRKLAQTLADEAGLPVVEFHTCHNITAEDFAAGETWVTLMQRNYDALCALEKKE